MSMKVTQTAVTQSFDLASDKLSDATQISNLCGDFTYSIVEDYGSFIAIDAAKAMITVKSDNMDQINTYTVTFQAKLVDYPAVTAVNLTFKVHLIDPCLTTSLTLPTDLQGFTITSWDLVGFQQTFAPATDYAADVALDSAGVVGLCGPRDYTIVQSQPSKFFTITPPEDEKNYESDWSLDALSANFADVGVWTVTLRVTLQNYPDIPAAEKYLVATVRDPCLDTVIQTFELENMYVSLYDDFYQVQSFAAAQDSFAIREDIQTPGICGTKKYVSSLFLAKIAPPTSGKVNEDDWTISSLTQQRELKANYTVTITISMNKYPTVASLNVTFNLSVYDPCEVAIIDNLNQTFADVNYIPFVDIGLMNNTFLPFSDSVDQNYKGLSICGAKNYTIVEEITREFVKIYPPDSGLNDTDPWIFAVNTTNITFVGTHVLTIQANIVDYPTSFVASIQVNITIIHPCTITEIKLPSINKITFALGSNLPSIMSFDQWSDTMANQLGIKDFCGEREYQLQKLDFVQLEKSQDPWASPFKLVVMALEDKFIGSHDVEIQCSLSQYLDIAPASTIFKVVIVINRPPVFNPKIATSITVAATRKSEPWSFGLAPIKDPENDPTTLTAQLGNAASFLQLNGKSSLEISDLSTAKDGMYLIKFIISDGIGATKVNFMLFVLPPPPLSAEELAAAAAAKEAEKAQQAAEQEQSKLEEAQKESKAKAVDVEFIPSDVLSQLSSNQKSSGTAKSGQQMIRAKTECIPFESTAKFNGTIVMPFFHDIQLENLNDVKKSGKIQLILIKADPQVPPCDFDWTIELSSNKTLSINLNISQPETISSTSAGSDYMRVYFKEGSSVIKCINMIGPARQLQGQSKQMPNKETYDVKLPIMFKTAAAEAAEALVGIANNPTSQGAVISSLIINYATGLSANLLWGGINSLQMIVTMTLFQISIPQNAVPVIQFVQTMVSFDMFYDIYDPTKKVEFTYTPPYSDNFQQVKFENMEFFASLGSVAVILVLTLIFQGAVPLVVLIAKVTSCDQLKCCAKVRNKQGSFDQSKYSVANSWIRLLLENYLNFWIAILLSQHAPGAIKASGQKMNFADKFSYSWSIISMLILIPFTLIVCYMVCYQYRQPCSEELLDIEAQRTERFINFYEEVLYKKGVDPEKIKANFATPGEPSEKPDLVLPDSRRPLKTTFTPKDDQTPKQSSKNQRQTIQILAGLSTPERQKEEWTERPSLLSPQQQTLRLPQINEESEESKHSIDKSPEKDLEMNQMETHSAVKILIRHQPEKIESQENGPRKIKTSKSQFKSLTSNNSINQDHEESEHAIDISQDKSLEMSFVGNVSELKSLIRHQPDTIKIEENIPRKIETSQSKDQKSVANSSILQPSKKNEQTISENQSKANPTQKLAEPPRLTGQTDYLKSRIALLDETTLKHNFSELLFKRATIRVKKKLLEEKPAAVSWISYDYFTSLREGFRPGSIAALFFHVNFLLRRMTVIFVAVWMFDTPLFQILIFMILTLGTMIYLAAVKPFDTPQQNKLELFNEFMVLLCSDVFTSLLGYYYTAQMLTNFGTLLNALIGVLFLGNIFLLIIVATNTIKNAVKRLWTQCKNRKKLAEIRKAREKAKQLQEEFNNNAEKKQEKQEEPKEQKEKKGENEERKHVEQEAPIHFHLLQLDVPVPPPTVEKIEETLPASTPVRVEEDIRKRENVLLDVNDFKKVYPYIGLKNGKYYHEHGFWSAKTHTDYIKTEDLPWVENKAYDAIDRTLSSQEKELLQQICSAVCKEQPVFDETKDGRHSKATTLAEIFDEIPQMERKRKSPLPIYPHLQGEPFQGRQL